MRLADHKPPIGFTFDSVDIEMMSDRPDGLIRIKLNGTRVLTAQKVYHEVLVQPEAQDDPKFWAFMAGEAGVEWPKLPVE